MALIIDFNAKKEEIEEFKEKARLQEYRRAINNGAPGLIEDFMKSISLIVTSENLTNKEKIEEIEKDFLTLVGIEYIRGEW